LLEARLHRRHLRVQLELQERLRRAHVRQAELELVDQRVRIARELHDVVAHGMSVITVQAGFAGLVSDDPEEVRSALGSIETPGRQTLNELRTLLGSCATVRSPTNRRSFPCHGWMTWTH